MWLRGELVCLNCGRVLGLVEGRKGESLKLVDGTLGTTDIVRSSKSKICCGRCGGRIILENLKEIPDSRYNSETEFLTV
jgi:hypothetical protein